MVVQATFLVTGAHRSGTSALMRFCITGGMLGNYTEEQDKSVEDMVGLVADNPRYLANPHGYFELGPRNIFYGEGRGYVTKKVLSHWNYDKMQKGYCVPTPLKVVCMRRPEKQRRASLSNWEWGPGGLEKRLKFQPLWDLWRQCHPGAEILEVDYAQLVSHPRTVANRMVDAGWPITDIEAARATIDPLLWRHK